MVTTPFRFCDHINTITCSFKNYFTRFNITLIFLRCKFFLETPALEGFKKKRTDSFDSKVMDRFGGRCCMRIGLAQMDISWEDVEKNMVKAESFFARGKKQKLDILVFPEMTLTGFSMNANCVGQNWQVQVEFFKRMSREYGIAVVFGYIMPVPDHELELHPDWNHYHNRLGIAVDGRLRLSYAKIHPFSYGLEAGTYQGGERIETMDWQGVGLGALICYDLRFPEVFQICSASSEVIFVISNWPAGRVDQMDRLLSARAIENQVYIVGVNRVGQGDGLIYNGHSAVYGPDGSRLTQMTEKEGLIIGQIDLELLRRLRREFPMKADRREDLYIRLWEDRLHSPEKK